MFFLLSKHPYHSTTHPQGGGGRDGTVVRVHVITFACAFALAPLSCWFLCSVRVSAVTTVPRTPFAVVGLDMPIFECVGAMCIGKYLAY